MLWFEDRVIICHQSFKIQRIENLVNVRTNKYKIEQIVTSVPDFAPRCHIGP